MPDKDRDDAWDRMSERDVHDRDRHNWRIYAGVSFVAGFTLGVIFKNWLERHQVPTEV
ncbi:MAG TPA: hypothetical protein VMY88_00115 [Acidimicrobiales bacterium]|nr:hypothetical protein [Acidimicrobiales bacterium]